MIGENESELDRNRSLEDGQSTNEPALGARQRSGGHAPLIWGIVAGVLAAVAVIRLPMAAVFVFALLALAAVAGVVAVVLGILALRRSKKSAGSLVGIVLGMVLGAAAIVVAGIGFTLSLSGGPFGTVSQVELRASSDSAFTVAYSDDVQERSGTSTAGEWRAMFGTRQAATEMTVTADEVGVVRCQIIRDGETVADESSDSGTVTCRVGDSQ